MKNLFKAIPDSTLLDGTVSDKVAQTLSSLKNGEEVNCKIDPKYNKGANFCDADIYQVLDVKLFDCVPEYRYLHLDVVGKAMFNISKKACGATIWVFEEGILIL